jgi:hypothetical protein
MAVRALLLAAAVGLFPTCGDGSPRTPLSALGRCDATHVDGVPAQWFLSQKGAWLRVRRIDLPASFENRSRRTFPGSYEVVGGDADAVSALGGPTVGTLTMHGSIARDVSDALAVTPDVYAHVDAEAKEVRFALALTEDDFAFLGECQERLFTSPLRRTLGPDAVATVRGFVGKTGAEVGAALR